MSFLELGLGLELNPSIFIIFRKLYNTQKIIIFIYRSIN